MIPAADQLFERARSHQLAGRDAEAVPLWLEGLALCPGCAAAHNNLGIALAALGRIDDAIVEHSTALALDPDHPGAHNRLGNILAARGNGESASAHFAHVISRHPADAEAWFNLANLFSVDQPERAVALYRHAIELQPGHAGAHNNLANVLTAQGDLDAALIHYDRAIAIRPAHAKWWYNRAQLHTFGKGDAGIAAMRFLEASGSPAANGPMIHFAQAKALEDTGDYVRAFAHLVKGNALKRAGIRYDEALVHKFADRIRRVFDGDLLKRFEGAGDPSSAPIFVLGMPRTGSTLVEQILASHPEVHGAGELPWLENSVESLMDCLPFLNEGGLRGIGEACVKRICATTGRARVINKAPQNFFYIGLIRLILPNARIIHTVRNPIDTCLSCFSTLFTSGQRYSYDLGELGRYYNLYRSMMNHWKSVLPGDAILDVAYEDVVDNLESSARRMTEFCGLEWDDRCLAFHKTRRSVLTASAVQVRRPIYRTSIERWRRFEFGLGPLLCELEGASSLRAVA